MKPGNVVEYATDDGHRLGAVTATVGKTKLVVVTESGDENRPARDDVTFTLAGNFDPKDRKAALQAVVRVETILAGIERNLDLAEIWAVAGSGIPYTLPELARACGNGSGMNQIALARRLRIDDVYFRQRKGVIEARSVGQVEERLQQIEAESAQVARRGDFVAALADVLQRPYIERAEAYAEVVASDPVFAELAELVEGFAADETSFPRREEAEVLLDELVRTADLRLAAHAAPRGFELMRQLRLWSEHEVLAVHRFGIRTEHGPRIEELAVTAAKSFDREGREDFTGWWALTIDDVDSTDIDDALSIRPTLDGGWEVAVHIADPGAFVPIGSELDADAQRRGATLYMPDRVVGMFPDALSEAMSLLVDVDRPALTTHVVFDQDLDIEEFRIVPSVVRINRKLSYDIADELLVGNGNDHTTSVLRDLAFVADELHARRMQGGARSIDLPEPRVRVDFDEDEDGHIDVSRVEPSAARNLIAEMMVLVGGLTARWCREHDVPIIFRVQDAPHTERDEDAIQRVPEGWPREMAVLMTMQRAAISTMPGPHAGLGIQMYAQATSPIRRYGDLVVQRQLVARLRDEPLPYDLEDLQRIAHVVERAHNELGQAGAEAETYWLTEDLRRREGQVIEAMVVASRGEGGRRAEVILLESGYRTTVRFRQPPQLGQTVRLRIDRAHPRTPSLTLEPVS